MQKRAYTLYNKRSTFHKSKNWLQKLVGMVCMYTHDVHKVADEQNVRPRVLSQMDFDLLFPRMP